jgi:hypothetical protein
LVFAFAIALAGCTGDDDAATARPTRNRPPVSKPASVQVLEWSPVLTDLGLARPSARAGHTIFTTGFEDDRDLAGFYVTPQSPMTRHEIVANGERHDGARAHHAWLTGQTGTEPVDGPNHRGYPTVQLRDRPCASPCLIDFWVRLDDVHMVAGEWVSLATFSTDASDRWTRVVTVNVGSEGWLSLFHVPTQGAGDRAFQRKDVMFPYGRWVHVTTLLDVAPVGGAVAVWQDGTLMSAARVEGGDGDVDQLHFGLYAAPTLTHASVWNDDIAVRSLASGDDSDRRSSP